MKKNRNKKLILHSKMWSPQHPKYLLSVLIANKRITLHQKCWNGPNAADRPNRFKQDQPIDNSEEGQSHGKLTQKGTYIQPQTSLKFRKQQLQWADYISARQYVISYPATIVYQSHKTLNMGIPSALWLHQLKRAYIQRYKNMQMIQKTHATYKHDNTENVNTQFRPLPEVAAYDTNLHRHLKNSLVDLNGS